MVGRIFYVVVVWLVGRMGCGVGRRI